jgi:hypothetical protein
MYLRQYSKMYNQWIVDTIFVYNNRMYCLVNNSSSLYFKVLGSQRAVLKINYHLLHSHQLFQCHCEVTHVVANVLSVFDNLFLLR